MTQPLHICGRVLLWSVALQMFLWAALEGRRSQKLCCDQHAACHHAQVCRKRAAMPGGLAQADSGALLALPQAHGLCRMMLGMSLTRGILLLYTMLSSIPAVITLTQAKAVNVSTRE